MNGQFEVLLIGNDDQDVELIKLELKKFSLTLTFTILSDQAAVKKYLSNSQVDIIIADFNLPGYDGFKALELSKEIVPDVPFILVSEYRGEEKAVDAMRKGASDYVSKNNLQRLGPAVQRELDNYIKHQKTKKERNRLKGDLTERVKEQQCLYNISRLNEQQLTANELLNQAVAIIPDGFRYAEIAEAAIIFNDQNYQTEHFSNNPSELHTQTTLSDNRPLSIRVVYTQKNNEGREIYFLFEEEKLLEQIKNILALKLNQIVATRELKKKQKFLNDANQIADIGHWELSLDPMHLYLSDKVKDIFEFAPEESPNPNTVLNYFKEGTHRQKVFNAFDRAIKKGQTDDLEVQIITAKGNERWIRTIGEPEFRNGKCIRVYGTTQDITEQKEAEQELLETQKKLQRAEQVARIGHWKLDLETQQMVCSEGFKLIFGVNRKGPIPYEEIKKIPLGEYREMLDTQMQRIVEEQSSYDVRFEIENNETGTILNVRNIAQYDHENGEQVFGVVKDITREVKNRADLKRAEKVAQIGYWELDISDNTIYASDGARAIYGISQVGTIDYETIKECALKQYRPMLNRKMKNLISNNDPYDIDFKIRNNEKNKIRWIHSVAEYDTVRERVFGIIQDITNRKKIEEQLRKSEQRYQSLFNKNHAAMLLIHPKTRRIVDANPAAEEFYGYSVDQLRGTSISDINILSDDRLKEEMKKAVSGDKKYFEFKHRVASGEVKDVVVYSGPIKIDSEQLLYSIIFDNTERKKAETKLKKLSAATEESPALILITDKEGTIEYVNPKFSEVTGYRRSELIGKNPRILKSGEQSQEFYERFWDTITSGEIFKGEFTNKKKNGKLYQVLVSVAPLKNKEGEITNFVAVQEDITERKKRELKLQQSLEEKQTLLSEIHHRVKNNLAVITSMIQLQVMESDDIELQGMLQSAQQRIQTIATIHELLYGSESFSHLDFGENVKDLLHNLEDMYGAKKEIAVDLQIEPIRMNINQAIPCALMVNEVVTNAYKHAFNNRKEGKISVYLQQNNENVIVEIKDNGVGIPNDVMQGESSAIGMALISMLKEQLEGDIQLSNKNGTQFRLEFQKADVKGSGSSLM